MSRVLALLALLVSAVPAAEPAELDESGWESLTDAPEAIESYEAVGDALRALEGPEVACGEAETDGARPARCPVPSPRCEAFIQPNCAYGALGLRAISDFLLPITPRSKAKSGKAGVHAGHFVNTPPADIARVCPRYATLDGTSRSRFWVWVLMSVAFEESGCGDDTKNEANRNATGLFQLDRSNDVRRIMRAKECEDVYLKRVFPGKKISDPEPNLRCAIATLSIQLSRPGAANAEAREDLTVLSPGKLVHKMSYWQKLKQADAGLVATIKSFPGCK